MRLVRLDNEPSTVGADVRTALTVWGAGRGVFGGVAVFGCQPPGCPRPLDAVIVLPRGIIVVVGVDLPDPALTLDAPMHTPWTVDGRPMVRAEGDVNPALEAVESATALAKTLHDREAEPLPVTTVVAVGPYVDRITQPTQDLNRGVRVVCPTTRTMLSAVRELATYERACRAEPAARLLRILGAGSQRLRMATLVDEGFPDVVSSDLASSETTLLKKVTDEESPRSARPTPSRPGTGHAVAGTPKDALTRRRTVTLGLVALMACLVIVLLLMTGTPGNSGPEPDTLRTVDVAGVEFTPVAQQRDEDCAATAFGDVQVWLAEQGCAGVDRALYETDVSGRTAGVAVAVLEFPSTAQAEELDRLFDQAGTGGVSDLVSEGHGWESGPRSFEGAAWATERHGASLHITQAVWSSEPSSAKDPALRTLADHSLDLSAHS